MSPLIDYSLMMSFSLLLKEYKAEAIRLMNTIQFRVALNEELRQRLKFPFTIIRLCVASRHQHTLVLVARLCWLHLALHSSGFCLILHRILSGFASFVWIVLSVRLNLDLLSESVIMSAIFLDHFVCLNLDLLSESAVLSAVCLDCSVYLNLDLLSKSVVLCVVCLLTV
ncbi:hypothetical protein Tco_1223605 [Tanacetum coccineum]